MILYIVLGVVLLALIGLVIYYFWRKKKEKQLAAAAAGGEVIAPGGDEISVLVHEAEKKLAAAKLPEGGKVASLPVFLIVGEPGTTKTSVMLHSGLEPELLSGQVYNAGNVSPTRSANFWFSRRTIFAEAGGGLIGDPGAWSKLVKRLQPKAAVVRKGEQAPRGVLVCFDCENFTKPGSGDIAANSARILRARLGEISQAMGINLPVYALFTRSDRLPFFTDFVRNLTNDESTQVLGVTLPIVDNRSEGVYAEEETTRLTGNFERLFRSLADARIEFLARENDATKLPPSYEFPREFRKVRPALVQFLVDLCRPSQLTVGPFLRGFYFTGVRPVVVNETAPVAAAAPQQQTFDSGATNIFAARAPGAAPAQAPRQVIGTRKVPQWLFLAHLFNDILLADKAAMGASGASTKTSTARRWLLISGAALAFLLSVYLTISFFNNHSLISAVSTSARNISSNESPSGDLASLDVLKRLETLRQSVETLSKYHKEGAPWTYHGFLYVGEKLYPEARRIYFDRFRQAMFGQTQGAILQNLKSLPVSPVPEHEYQPTYDSLKAYLMTTSYHEKTTKLFLTPTLMSWWTRGRGLDPDRQALAQKQFDFYAEELKEENPYSSENDGLAVERSRAYLKQFAGTERVYNFMLAEADKRGKSVNFNRDFPGSAAVLINTKDVRGAFSAGGRKFMNDAIAHADQYFNGEPWVLGEQSGPAIDRAKLEQELRARYSSDYLKAWTDYIKAGNVLRYASLKDAANKLKQHSSNTAPVLEMSAQASQNTAGEDPTSQAFQPVQFVTPPNITDRYVGGSNQGYISALLSLQGSIESVADQNPPNEAALAQTLQVAKQAEATVGQIAQGFRIDSPVQALVQKLLMDPITNAEGLLKPPPPGAELNAKGGALCKQISPVMAKYPFNLAKGAPDATLQDVNSLFKPPDGALWQFVQQNLTKFLQKQGSQYVPIPGAPNVIRPEFLGWLNRASAFTDAAYGEGTPDPRLKYTVKPLPSADIDNTQLTIDGVLGTFPGDAAQPKQYIWPGSGNLQLNVKFKSGPVYRIYTFTGLWAVFKFVDQADNHVGNVVTATLGSGNPKQTTIDDASGHPVTVKLELTVSPPVFDYGYFSRQLAPCVAGVANAK